jgi:hypothetical protein
MIDKNVRFINPLGRGMNVDVASNEPSHIHVARPSRLRRGDHPDSSVEPTGEVRDLAAAEVVVQAA